MTQRRSRGGLFWSRLHFLIRFLGVTGLLAACVGLVVVQLYSPPGSWQEAWAWTRDAATGVAVPASVYLVLGGAATALLALLVEACVVLRIAAARRSLLGSNAVLQIVLAAALLIGVNLFSVGVDLRGLNLDFVVPGHFTQVDCTRDQRFTLPAPVRAALQKLDRDTTIVVYQRHKTFGSLNDKPDRYDYAAERKTVEKVKDLVDQFRAEGPRFRVVVLDVEEEGYDKKLEELTADAPALKSALNNAVENSIFFYAATPVPGGDVAKRRELVQQLSFSDFLRLDKTGSQEADGNRGNLRLLAQGAGPSGRGVEPFAGKILNLNERKPVVGVAVVHEWLTTRGTDVYGLAGLKKTLTAHGFEVRDIVLKRFSRSRPPDPVVYTFDERKLEKLDGQLKVADYLIRNQAQAVQKIAEEQQLWTTSSLEDLKKKYHDTILEADRQEHLNDLARLLASVKDALAANHHSQEGFRDQRKDLDVDALREQQRMTDLQAKMSQFLAECDLLIVPRPSIYDVLTADRNLPLWLHNLDPAQTAAIHDFLKAGKPILACVGSANESPEEGPPPPGFSTTDDLENMLAKLGIRFGKQTVLFDKEMEAFGEQQAGGLTAGADVVVPPVTFDWPEGAGRPPGQTASWPDKVNPLRASLRLASRSLGDGRALDLSLRHPRPVYFDPPPGAAPAFSPYFMMTDAESWNEDQPFPTADKTPSFQSPSEEGPAHGGFDARRRGPFPVGVAVEVPPPAEWYASGETKPRAIRAAAIGQGWFLIGPELTPAKERLLLDTCNWLTGRDDALARDDHPWSYPRVDLDPREQELWLWGVRLGLPALFAWLGVIVLLVRRLR